ncbi:MAG: hypothetical protein LBG79_07130 [Spirochaetaceae bacterium]|jgi:murein DD-endopeptidase MepM/ murein hydrolase activator NlpD|nr:hypothetical protein [Spirochaetaceae bacterium]
MKFKLNSRKERNLKNSIIGVLLLVAMSGNLAAQSLPPPDVKYFNKNVFDYHFSRADRELSPDKWMDEARLGLNLAFGAWEQLALSVLDGEALEIEREKLLQWSESELAERYAKWLGVRFFAAEESRRTSRFSNRVRSENLDLFYYLDANGNIIYDAETGDPLVVRPDFGRDLFADKLFYEQYIDDESKNITGVHKARLQAYYPELLEYIEPERRGEFEIYLQDAAAGSENALRDEFERIKIKEERLLTAKRSGDIWSLRKKTDKEAAGVITDGLISETQQICEKNIAALQQRIEAAQAGTGNLTLEGERWLSEYQEQFNAGLKAWQEAEERFFVRRIEWEQSAGKSFEQGEEAWSVAFARFGEEREKWEIKSNELFEEGKKLFNNLSAELNAAIKSAKEEMERDIETRSRDAGARAQSWLETYISAGKIVVSAQEYIEFWVTELRNEIKYEIDETSRVLNEKRNILNIKIKEAGNYNKEINRGHYLDYSDKKSVWVPYHSPEEILELRKALNAVNNEISILRAELKPLQTKLASLNAEQQEAVKEAPAVSHKDFSIWLAANEAKKDSERGAKRELAVWFEMYTKYMQSAQKAKETLVTDFGLVMGSGALTDVLSNGVRSGDFNLDEFQIELLRAQAVSNYWERKADIAQAVFDYSTALTAGRTTNVEGEAKRNDTKARYESAKAAYEAGLIRLKEAQNAVEDKRQEIDEVILKLRIAEAEVSRLNEEYTNIKMVYELNDAGETIREEMIEHFSGYLTLEGELLKRDKDSVYYNYLQKMRLLGADGVKFDSEQALVKLVAGGEETQSLAELKEAVNETEKKIADKQNEDAGSSEEELNSLLAEKQRRVMEYQLRKAEIELLSSESTAAWLTSVFNDAANNRAALDEEEINDIKDKGAYAWLEECYSNTEKTINDYYNDVNEGTSERDYELENQLGAEIKFYGGLLNALDNCALSSRAAVNENYAREQKRLKSFFRFLGISAEEGEAEYLIPDAEKIKEALLSEPQDFADNIVELCTRIAALRGVLPVQFSQMFFEWTSEFIGYTAALGAERGLLKEINIEDIEENLKQIDLLMANGMCDDRLFECQNYNSIMLQLAIARDEYNKLCEEEKDAKQKNWRVYLNDSFNEEFFTKKQIQIESEMAAFGFADAELNDRFNSFKLNLNLLNDALSEFNLNEYGDFSELVNDAEKYLNNPEECAADSIKEEFLWQEELKNEKSGYNGFLAQLEYQRQQFSLLGYAYDFATSAKEEIKKQMDAARLVFEDAEAQYKEAAAVFDAEVNIMSLKSAEYETVYESVMKLYNEVSFARHEYEKQEAIRRWASTAYLGAGTPESDLRAANENSVRAKIVLDALTDVYNNGETKREYNTAEYQEVYEKYKRAFEDMAFNGKVKYELEAEIKRETERNNMLYKSYSEEIANIAGNLLFSRNESAIEEGSVFPFIEVDEAGRLRFATGERPQDLASLYEKKLAEARLAGNAALIQNLFSFEKLSSGFSDSFVINQSEDESEKLKNHFTAVKENGTETREVTDFELALRNLTEYMSANLTSVDAYIRWGLAKDFLIQTLCTANKGNDLFEGNLNQRDSALTDKNSNLGKKAAAMIPFGYSSVASKSYSDYQLWEKQLKAYNSLGEEERANLEFFVILMLSGGGGSEAGTLRNASRYVDYKKVYDIVSSEKDKAEIAFTIACATSVLVLPIILILCYNDARNQLGDTKNSLKSPLNESKAQLDKGSAKLAEETKNSVSYLKEYQESSERLAKLNGEAPEGAYAGWAQINISLETAGIFSEEEIERLRQIWEEVTEKKTIAGSNVPVALGELLEYHREQRKERLEEWDAQWAKDEEARTKEQSEYRKFSDGWIAEGGEAAALEAAVRKVYNAASAARKNHTGLIETELLNEFSGLNERANIYEAEVKELAGEYSNNAQRFLAERLTAELNAQESLWEVQIKELNDKYKEWQRYCELILENGRADWKAGRERMLTEYEVWRSEFNREYQEISQEWDGAYLVSLEEKNEWVEAASQAALGASRNEFAALMNMSGAKKFDTFSPLGRIKTNGAEEAGRILKEVLNSSGIVQMESAMLMMNSAVGDVQAQKARYFNVSGFTQRAEAEKNALQFAKEMNESLAERESKRLAATLKSQIQALKAGIIEAIRERNENFVKQMDEMFIFCGQWSRSGKNYRKDVVAHSTLVQPVITESAFVEGYREYSLSQDKITLELKIDLSEERLNGINSTGINLIMREAQKEIKGEREKIFGKYNSNNEKESRGTIDKWIEYKGGKDNSPGGVEYNRLTEEFNKWAQKEALGVGALTAALWDKPMWDSRGSFFEAPSLRSIGSIAASVVGTILSGGLGAAVLGFTNSFLFNTLDAAGGYKTVSESMFAIGKDALIAGVSLVPVLGGNAISGALGKITEKVSGWAGTLLSKSAEIGIGVATQTAQTLLSNVNYSSSGGLSYNGKWEDLGTSALSGALSSAASFGIAKLGSIEGLSKFTQGAVGKTVMKMTDTLTTGTINSTISAVTFDGGIGFSKEKFYDGMKNVARQTVVSGIDTFVSSKLENKHLGQNDEKAAGFDDVNKIGIGNYNSTVGTILSQSANIAMGGEAVFNIAAMMGKADSQGFLEMHIGGKGFFGMNFGTGGIDMSVVGFGVSEKGLSVNGGRIGSALAGAKAIAVNEAIGRHVKETGADVAVALRAQYGFGDDLQKEQLKEILSGKTVLNLSSEGDAVAQTVMEDGKRVVSLNGYKEGMSVAEQMALGLTLGHEAYRDGIVDKNNVLETREAVAGHTEMALRMFSDSAYKAEMNNIIGGNVNLQRDITAYIQGSNVFNAYADSNYDSSADFWKLMENGALEYDGDGWLKDSKGALWLDENKNPIGAQGIESGLAKILGISADEAASILTNYGFFKNGSNKCWFDDKNKDKSVNLKQSGSPADYAGFSVGTSNYYLGLYQQKLDKYNTLSIYNNLLFDGIMAKDNSGSFISYNEYKARNFIINEPVYYKQNTFESAPVSGAFDARSGKGYVHRGVDAAVSGEKVMPLFYNDTSRVVKVNNSLEDEKTAQGKYVVVATDITYNYQGQTYTETIYNRVLHLEKTNVEVGSAVNKNTVLGISGNTGLWEGGGYASHAHEDVYTITNPKLPKSGVQGSPYLNSLSEKVKNVMPKNKMMPSYETKPVIEHDGKVYYDKFIIADKSKYNFRKDAYKY